MRARTGSGCVTAMQQAADWQMTAPSGGGASCDPPAGRRDGVMRTMVMAAGAVIVRPFGTGLRRSRRGRGVMSGRMRQRPQRHRHDAHDAEQDGEHKAQHHRSRRAVSHGCSLAPFRRVAEAYSSTGIVAASRQLRQ